MTCRGAPDAPVFVADGVMDDETCRRVRAAMDTGEPEPSDVLGDGIAQVDEVRRASHIEVSPEIVDLVAAHLDAQRPAVATFFGCRLGEREGVNLLRYIAGGFYRPHVDRAFVSAWPPAARRSVTAVLFLDSCRDVDPAGGFGGGILRLHAGEAAPLDVLPRRGTLVAFPADTLHEVTPVTGGHRDTVVDWFYERRPRRVTVSPRLAGMPAVRSKASPR